MRNLAILLRQQTPGLEGGKAIGGNLYNVKHFVRFWCIFLADRHLIDTDQLAKLTYKQVHRWLPDSSGNMLQFH